MARLLLLDLNKGSRIYAHCSDGSTYLIFDHIDGMYSYCTTEKGDVVHLAASTPLETIDGGGYKIV